MSDLNFFMRVTAIPELFDRLYGDAERLSGDVERLQRIVELMMAQEQEQAASVADSSAPAPAPEPSASEPVEMESSARQRLQKDAAEAAEKMVTGFDLMTQQGQSTATSLAYALRIARQASPGFQCPTTMYAILNALDGMDAAAREEQSNG